MSMVGHDSTEKSIVSFISKITVCWHFTAAVFKSLASAERVLTFERIYNMLLFEVFVL